MSADQNREEPLQLTASFSCANASGSESTRGCPCDTRSSFTRRTHVRLGAQSERYGCNGMQRKITAVDMTRSGSAKKKEACCDTGAPRSSRRNWTKGQTEAKPLFSFNKASRKLRGLSSRRPRCLSKPPRRVLTGERKCCCFSPKPRWREWTRWAQGSSREH